MRPSYHYTPAANWLSDPNGLVHDGQRWHMFYQYNPHDEDWGHMSWGHASSRDLADWQDHGTAIAENDRHMIFSGSAVIDAANTAGFGAGAMVAIYTGATCGAQQRQVQCLAHSADQGLTWQEYSANPVIDLGLADFRDPSVFWHAHTHRWVMVVALSAENAALIFVSENLRDWRETCRIEGHDAQGREWECPALVELPVLGTDRTRWLFKVDALHAAPGSGALYRTGEFDGEVFSPDESGWQVADHGADFYAAIPWNGPADAQGRPCWIGWMGNHTYQKHFPKRGWRGVMSVPRRMGLRMVGDRLVLAQAVEPSVLALFGDGVPLADDACAIPTACRIDIEPGIAGRMEIADAPGRSITLVWQDGRLTIDRVDRELPFLDCSRHFACAPEQQLSIFMDSETCEIIAADGTLAAGFQHRAAHAVQTLRSAGLERVSVAALR